MDVLTFKDNTLNGPVTLIGKSNLNKFMGDALGRVVFKKYVNDKGVVEGHPVRNTLTSVSKANSPSCAILGKDKWKNKLVTSSIPLCN